MWSRVVNTFDFERAMKLARGSYQKDILFGRESMSGSTLRGRASKWSNKYRTSRFSLLNRLQKHGIKTELVKGENGQIILVIGDTREGMMNIESESC